MHAVACSGMECRAVCEQLVPAFCASCRFPAGLALTSNALTRVSECVQADWGVNDEPRSEVSNEYDALIASCLALNPQDRPTMDEIVAALATMAAKLGMD